jgi:hypothetical protein
MHVLDVLGVSDPFKICVVVVQPVKIFVVDVHPWRAGRAVERGAHQAVGFL